MSRGRRRGDFFGRLRSVERVGWGWFIETGCGCVIGS